MASGCGGLVAYEYVNGVVAQPLRTELILKRFLCVLMMSGLGNYSSIVNFSGLLNVDGINTIGSHFTVAFRLNNI